MNSVNKNNYHRLDIQGLRGLAILSVIFFHFFPKLFPMGYLGVDLFFVISGFLITSIVSKKLEEKNFLFKIFYIKRVYRIITPLLFVLIFFGIISFFILLPQDLNIFWNSLLSTLLFVPNIFFWTTGGYFGSANEYKALLHLWSIGLELQFYFLFPFILFCIFKYFNNNKFYYVLLLLIIFFIINLVIINTNFSFFNLPGRLWEFLIGSLVFFLAKKKINKIIYYISLFLILFLLIFFLSKFNFFSRFILVIASGFVIYCNSNSFLNYNIFQFFGKISYSLYLIHWPILSFVKYYLIRDLFYYESIFLFFLSITISYYFWFYIEDFFRKKLPYKFSVRLTIILVVILITTYFLNIYNKSFTNRLSPNNLLIANSVNSNFRCKINNYSFDKDHNSCRFLKSKNKDEIVLLGNSHAQMYGYAFEKIINTLSVNGRILSLNGCLPTTSHNISIECIDKANKNLLRIIDDKNISMVLIGLDWDHTFLFDKHNNKIEKNVDFILVESLNLLFSELNKNGKKVFVIGPISIPGYYFAFDLSRKEYFKNTNINLSYYNDKNEFEKRYQNIFNYLKKIKYVSLIKPHEVQCSNSKCHFLIDGRSIFSDNNHLSKEGSLLMEKLLLRAINESRAQNR